MFHSLEESSGKAPGVWRGRRLSGARPTEDGRSDVVAEAVAVDAAAVAGADVDGDVDRRSR